MNSNKPLISITGTALFLAVSSSVWISDAGAQAQNQPPAAQQQGQQAGGADIQVQQPAPQISVQQIREAQSGAALSSQSLAELQGGWRSTNLKGATVRNAQGQDIGKVRDLIVSKDGQVSRVVLSAGDRTVQVPFKDLQISQPDHVVYSSAQPLDQQPTYIPPQGTEAQNGKVPPLVGREVRNAQGTKVAKVDDLVIAPDGRVSVILSTGAVMGMGGKLVAVPFSSVQLTGQDYLLYNGNSDQLAQLPKFDYDQLKQSIGGATTGSTQGQRQGKTE